MSVEDRPEHQPRPETSADESWETALSPPPSQIEAQQRAEIEKLHQPFLVASVCRADLEGILTDEEIAQLDDSDMERIAEKMATLEECKRMVKETSREPTPAKV